MKARKQLKRSFFYMMFAVLLTLPALTWAQSFGTIRGPNDRPSLNNDRNRDGDGASTIINNNYYYPPGYGYGSNCYGYRCSPQTDYQIDYQDDHFGISIGNTRPHTRPHRPLPPPQWQQPPRKPRQPAPRRLPSAEELRSR